MERPAAPTSYRWLIFAIVALAYVLVYFHRLCPAVVAEKIMSDLAAGPTLMGVLASAYFYPYALMQIPAGLLSDSWGPRRSMTLFLGLAAVGSFLFGLAQTPLVATLARLLVGLGVALVFVPALKILTHWFRRSEFGLMTGLLMAMGGVGAYTAATPLDYASRFLGWRGSFMAMGGLTVLVMAGVWFLVRNRPEDLGYPPVEHAVAPADGQAPAALGLWQGAKLVLSCRHFWPLALWFAGTFAVFFSFAGLWAGPFLARVYGLPQKQVGFILSLSAFAMILGSPFLSYLSDRVFRSRKKVLLLTSALLLVCLLPLAWAPDFLPAWSLYPWFFVVSLVASAIAPVGFTMAKELFPVAIAGTSVGLINLFPFFAGAVMQPLVGRILENQGSGGTYTTPMFSAVFVAYLVCAGLALVGAGFLRETYNREPMV